MSSIFLITIMLSAYVTAPASDNPNLSAEITRVHNIVHAIDNDLDAVGVIKTANKKSIGYICIRAKFVDDKFSEHACVRMYKFNLSSTKSEPVNTGITKASIIRKKVDGFRCATLTLVEELKRKTKKTDESFCLMNGTIMTDLIFLDENDPELDVKATLTCIGDGCNRK